MSFLFLRAFSTEFTFGSQQHIMKLILSKDHSFYPTKVIMSYSICSQSSSEYEPEYEPESIIISENKINLKFEVLTVVPPPLEYMSSLHSSQQEISGRQVWCGSLLLTEFLLDTFFDCDSNVKTISNHSFLHEKRVLELGSGTGIVGMSVATCFSTNCVALTDGDEEAVDLLIQNLQNKSNLCDGTNINSKGLSRVKGTNLLWGSDADVEEKFCNWCRSEWPSTWTQDESIAFDILLAGDVLYKSQLPTLFFSTVKKYMAKDGVLYLCHVPRADVDQKVVKDAVNDANLVYEEMDLTNLIKKLPDSYPHHDIERASIYKITFDV